MARDRNRISVTIRSRHGQITTGKQATHGFADIQTLHALISDPTDQSLPGTELTLHGSALGAEQVEQAKALFLRYPQDRHVGSTPYGTVLRRKDTRTPARIYVNGLRVAEEDDFLFSYNITSPTKALRRALNRERSNVGRGASTDRVKAILLSCEDDEMIDALVADLQQYERGTQHDETQWLDVARGHFPTEQAGGQTLARSFKFSGGGHDLAVFGERRDPGFELTPVILGLKPDCKGCRFRGLNGVGDSVRPVVGTTRRNVPPVNEHGGDVSQGALLV